MSDEERPDPDALLKAIRHPNGRVKNKSATFESHFFEQANSESKM